MGSGAAKFHTESLIESFKIFANFLVIMIIASVLLMILSSKAYSKFNHNFYIVVLYIRNTPLTISMIILTLIQIYNIFVIVKYKELSKK